METNNRKYLKFFAMIATSMVVMFGLMYLNTYTFDHLEWSQTRFYMTFIMGAAMSVVMLLFMLDMYQNKVFNIAILAGSVGVAALALYSVRAQVGIGDKSWMNAMIPHHSIAILTSENADLSDVRVRELANGIIDTQRREIKEMQWLLNDIDQNGKVLTEEDAEARPVPDFSKQPSE